MYGNEIFYLIGGNERETKFKFDLPKGLHSMRLLTLVVSCLFWSCVTSMTIGTMMTAAKNMMPPAMAARFRFCFFFLFSPISQLLHRNYAVTTITTIRLLKAATTALMKRRDGASQPADSSDKGRTSPLSRYLVEKKEIGVYCFVSIV